MIKFYDQVPQVYPNTSRDFQYLSWLINIVLNSVKHNVDSLYYLPNTQADPRLTELLAMTLGFKVKRNYDQKQLAALVAVLPRILKYKGTKLAIEIAGNALMAAAGTYKNFSSDVINGELTVFLPEDLVDVSLFTDLLPYILPAGMTYRIVKTSKSIQRYTIDLRHQDRLLASWIPDITWDTDSQTLGGLSKLFDVGSDTNSLTNYQINTENNIFNAGLLENTVIPMIPNAMAAQASEDIDENKEATEASNE